MDDSTNITTELDQTDEDILTYEVSDDALEAVTRGRGGERRGIATYEVSDDALEAAAGTGGGFWPCCMSYLAFSTH